MTRAPETTHDDPTIPLYAFEITLHGLPGPAAAPDVTGGFRDAHGEWPALALPRDVVAEPMAVGFDTALDRLDALPRMFVEPDGAFVWASPREGRRWQVDGNAFERTGRVLLVDLKGSCPASAFDSLLACFGWPEQALAVQLVRAGVFVDLDTFRSHATRRAIAGDAETLRPG
jgi:hypothetical protein